ncbi:MAG TPA: hypothetical protein VGQ83_05435 [Polyangia bacterium]|jgi:hypothetical protein
MRHRVAKSLREGFQMGILAGVVFAIMEIVGAALAHASPLLPFRLFASVILGHGALTAPAVFAFMVGGVVHVIFSAAFGVVYGLVNGWAGSETRTSWATQIVLGLVYGLVLWVVPFQLVGRVLSPAFLEADQMVQLLLHMVFFGLPLGLFYVMAERHAWVEPRRGEPPATSAPSP